MTVIVATSPRRSVVHFAGSNVLGAVGRWFGVAGDDEEIEYRQAQYMHDIAATGMAQGRTN